MLERLIITIAIIGLFVLAYLWFKQSRLKRAQQQASTSDPLLSSLTAGQPAILYFTADWCGACKLHQRPALQQLQSEQPDLKVVMIDVDAQLDDAKRWGVLSLPTTIVLDSNHVPIAVNHGAVSAHKLSQQLKG